MGMTLARLAEIVQQTVQMEKHPERVEVVISTEVPYMTCGQKPCTGVRCVGMGIDWEANQFRITPEEKVMCLKDNVPQKVLEWEGRYHCPKCEHMLSKKKDKDIRYCSRCGTGVRWDA